MKKRKLEGIITERIIRRSQGKPSLFFFYEVSALVEHYSIIGPDSAVPSSGIINRSNGAEIS